jgi:hypothetical protein
MGVRVPPFAPAIHEVPRLRSDFGCGLTPAQCAPQLKPVLEFGFKRVILPVS